MKTTTPFRRSLLLLVVLSAMLISACSPTRIGEAWGALELVNYNEQPRILISYNSWTIMLEPNTGKVVSLVNADGEIRYDDAGAPRKWEIDGGKFDGAKFFSRPVARDVDGVQTLLIPAYNDRLLTADLETTRIDNTAGVKMTSPIIADIAEDETYFYVPLFNHDVIALDKVTLEEKWRFVTTKGVWSKPIVADGKVYVATSDHFLYAIDAKTGEALWEKPADLGGLVGAAPLLLDGYLYVGSATSHLYKVDASTGEIVQQFQTKNWIWSTPVVDTGVLFVADLSGWVYALNPSDLSVVWQTLAAEKGIRPSPLVTESVVIVASRDGIIHWLDRQTGASMLVREIEGRPEVLSDLLLVPANEPAEIYEPLVVVSTLNMSHLVVAYTLETGNQKWVYGR